MTRWLAALALALSLAPRPAAAQLAKWCLDPTQGACFTVTAYEYAQFIDTDGEDVWYDHYVSLSGFWTGDLIESTQTINGTPVYWKFATDITALGLTGDDAAHYGDGTDWLGETGTATHRFRVTRELAKTPELSDVRGIWNANYGACSVNVGNPEWAPCTTVSVPEPATLPLLAGGLLSFAVVGWRRRRA